MANFEQRQNSGALFKNDRAREGKNDPQYQGTCLIDGREYWIAGWVKEGNKGKFFSLAFKPKESKPDPGRYQPPTSKPPPNVSRQPVPDPTPTPPQEEDQEVPF